MSTPAGSRRVPFVVPELGLRTRTATATAWLASTGARVIEGDRLLEVCLGDATIDLPAPATGWLVEKLVAEEDPVTVGQLLGWIEPDVGPAGEP